jgi:ureidoacrylate peracid hydrolase
MTDTEAQFEAAERLSHRPLLRTLEQKVDPTHAALIVVDMQNDFCAPGGMMDKEGADLGAVQAMARRLPELIDAARQAGALVVFIRNVYSSDGNSYLSDVYLEQAARRRGGSYTLREVCAAGSWDGDFYENIRPLPSEPVVTKHRYGAFHNTDLETILRVRGIRTVVLTGVATNVCVETTAREAFMRDFYVVFAADGTACYSDDAHEATLRTIDKYIGPVAPVAEIADIWRRSAGVREPEPELVAPVGP